VLSRRKSGGSRHGALPLPRRQRGRIARHHRGSRRKVYSGLITWRRVARGLQGVCTMLRNRRPRRVVAALLAVAGALLMLFSPSVEIGLIAFALGVALELAGLSLEHRDRP